MPGRRCHRRRQLPLCLLPPPRRLCVCDRRGLERGDRLAIPATHQCIPPVLTSGVSKLGLPTSGSPGTASNAAGLGRRAKHFRHEIARAPGGQRLLQASVPSFWHGCKSHHGCWALHVPAQLAPAAAAERQERVRRVLGRGMGGPGLEAAGEPGAARGEQRLVDPDGGAHGLLRLALLRGGRRRR
eukprot:scaffold18425_cov51-Phaeocystis_antarctica.AAC.2